MTEQQLQTLIKTLRSWPEEDQNELADIVRDIEARRSGLYSATPGELDAIDDADTSGIATQEDVEAAFQANAVIPDSERAARA